MSFNALKIIAILVKPVGALKQLLQAYIYIYLSQGEKSLQGLTGAYRGLYTCSFVPSLFPPKTVGGAGGLNIKNYRKYLKYPVIITFSP